MNTFLVWVRAIRPFSFTASIIPVLVGGLLALGHPEVRHWWLLPLAILAGVVFHMGTNLISDYYDYKLGVDTPGSLGSSGVLVAKLLPPKQIYWAGVLAFAVGIAIGCFLWAERGPTILYLGLAGLVGGYFYCAKPIGYKYIALGDLCVFLLMGPLMVVGGFAVVSEAPIGGRELFASVPIGFLVDAILHSNNLRDIRHDSDAHITTFAIFTGLNFAKYFYFFLVLGSFVWVLAMVGLGYLPYPVLLVFLSFVPAWKNIKQIRQAELGHPEKMQTIDISTAQHHFLFGLLLGAGLLAAAFL